jgi:Ca2+-binding EF-hand superfamily protein
VNSRGRWDYRAAFAHYDAGGSGAIDRDELKALLRDAGIGSGLTRWAWAKGIMGEVDTGGDGTISWEEFEAVFRTGQSGTPRETDTGVRAISVRGVSRSVPGFRRRASRFV